MRKARAHSSSKQVDIYPEIRECPECHSGLKERYHNQRWIIQLSQELKVKSHYLECGNRDCGLREAIYRPAEEGMQPEKSHETLNILRDVRTRRVLVAKNLLSSASSEIEKLIEEIIALGLSILGVISDKQDSIRLAVENKLVGVPHQICHYHYL